MALSHDIISQFAKIVNSDKKSSTETTIYGTVVDSEGNKYVQPDGSDQLIPIVENDEDIVKGSTVTNTEVGDRVSVLIKDHTATVTGNISSPSTNNKEVDSKITEATIIIAEQMQADKAYIQKLIADEATIGKLQASELSVTELIAKKAEIEQLLADKITVTDLIARKVDTDIVVADEAIIEHLKASSVDVLSLIADMAVIEDLIANNADLNSLEAKNAYLKYANVDFSNIGEATISKLFTDYGVIKELVIEDGTVVKELVGVTIKGDLIEAGTLKADRLVVKGSDGNYYALSTDFTAMPGVTPVEEDSIHGSVLVKKSIVAEKIAVDDLVAFGATIGGFKIGKKSIYSGVKESVNNITRGIYMDIDGQFAVGDGDNYIKYGKDEKGGYKLDISLVNDLEIGGRNLLRNTNTLIDWIKGPNVTISDEVITFASTTTLAWNSIGNTACRIPFADIRNNELTLSFDVRSDEYESINALPGNGLFASLCLMKNDASVRYAYRDVSFFNYNLSDEWQRISYTFTATDELFNSRTGDDVIDVDTDEFAVYLYDYSLYSMQIRKIKLEKGNKATDWTPAPEDMASAEDLKQTKTSVASLTATTNQIVAQVENVETTLSDNGTDIDNLKKDVASLKVSADQVSINIDKVINDGVKKVDTGTGFVFSEEGMSVNKTNAPTNTMVTENGMTVNSNATGDSVLTANKDGVGAKNLHAKDYLIVGKQGGRSRFEDYGSNRTACFWIGE